MRIRGWITAGLLITLTGWISWHAWDDRAKRDPLVRTWPIFHADLPPLRVAVLGDFHFRTASDLAQLSRIKRQLIAEAPDLILFVGDFIDAPRRDHAPSAATIVQALDALAFPDPAFAVLGNHEHIDGAQQWRDAFGGSRIQLLENTVVSITLDTITLCIRGLGDRYSNAWEPTAVPEDCGGRVMTMTHDPAGLITNETQLDTLSVAGHTHCGQIRIPLIGPPFVPTSAPPEMHCGLYQRGHYGLTTGGLGTSILPIRWGSGTDAGWDMLLINPRHTAEPR